MLHTLKHETQHRNYKRKTSSNVAAGYEFTLLIYVWAHDHLTCLCAFSLSVLENESLKSQSGEK